MYAKDLHEEKNQYLIKICEKVSIDHHNDPRVYVQYSNDMRDVYININYYNPDKEKKILIVFDDIIADMINNKKLNSIVAELFVKGSKLSICFVLIMQSYFKVPKYVRLNTTYFFIAKIQIRRELQQIEMNHSADVSIKGFANIYRDFTGEPYAFLVNDTTPSSDNPLRFRKNLFDMYNKNHDN